MKVGYSITSSYPPAVQANNVANELLARAELAHELGFDYIQCGDHHVVSDEQYFQNIPTAARLTGAFNHVASMVLLPLYNPVLVAEQIGTLGAFADHVDFWCAIGYGQEAFEAFDIPFDERVPRFIEGLEIATQLWREDDVTYDGDFYSISGVSVNPKTIPRVCVGGGVKPAVRRAGRVGDAWVAGPRENLDDLHEKIGWYERGGGGTVIARRDTLALPDGERARKLAMETLKEGYRGWPSGTDTLIAGDQSDVAEAFDELADVGVDEVVVRPMDVKYASETLETISNAR